MKICIKLGFECIFIGSVFALVAIVVVVITLLSHFIIKALNIYTINYEM